jgi:hypothetical protein
VEQKHPNRKQKHPNRKQKHPNRKQKHPIRKQNFAQLFLKVDELVKFNHNLYNN